MAFCVGGSFRRGSPMNNLTENKKPRNNCRLSTFDGSGAAGKSGGTFIKTVDVSPRVTLNLLPRVYCL